MRIVMLSEVSTGKELYEVGKAYQVEDGLAQSFIQSGWAEKKIFVKPEKKEKDVRSKDRPRA